MRFYQKAKTHRFILSKMKNIQVLFGKKQYSIKNGICKAVSEKS